jgi:uroporphyrinogen III methyltransferase/synthase
MTVYLVGAGPGDPGLLTVRGAELLGRADVVVHDRLADSRLLSLAPAGARFVDVGKAPGAPVHQGDIDRLLVEEGKAGRTVVRLKGGDPFVFGRGGEEAAALQLAGVEFEVVPGITSAIAVPAYAGVPVTHRGLSTSLTVVTGHSRHAVDRETNWEALAAAGGTIVILMGVAHRAEIAARLMAGGLDPATPVAAVHWGSRPEQVTTRVRLDRLGAAPLEPPATIVVGAVAGMDLGWFEHRPLFSRRVIVTRARESASGLARKLQDLGARVVEVPTIRVEPAADGGVALGRATAELVEGRYDWLAFTSAHAVDALFDRVPDTRRLGPVSVAAVGPATADALARYRIVPDLQAPVGREEAAGLADVFPRAPNGGRVLFPRAAGGRNALVEGLTEKGWAVELVEAYRTVRPEVDPSVRAEVAGAEAICFSSSSTVTGFLEALGKEAVPPVVVCIGPVTAATARAAGVEVTSVATRASVDGLVDAVIGALRPPA